MAQDLTLSSAHLLAMQAHVLQLKGVARSSTGGIVILDAISTCREENHFVSFIGP